MSMVANNIKYLRRMNGLTQEQFARKIGIKRSLLGAYEEGRANPNLDNLMNIAKIFGTTVDNLLKHDIRRLRENQGVPIPQPSPQLQLKTEPEAPQPLSAIIDKYYRQPASQPVGQPIAFRRVNNKNAPPPPFAQPEPKAPPVPVPAPAHPAPYAASPYNQPPVPAQNTRSSDAIEWVSQQAAAEYLVKYAYPDFLKQLPEMKMPGLPAGKYRAFQMGKDFPFPGATVVGQYMQNWYDIRDGQHYVVVVHKQGILYRRLFNYVKIKGSLLVISDLPDYTGFEVSIKDVLEVWEARAFFSYEMPEPKTTMPLDQLYDLTLRLQQEIERLRQ